MNALRTVFNASRAFRIALAGLLMAGLLVTASLAGRQPAPTHGLGAALSLISQQRVPHAQINPGLRHGPDGRVLLDNRLLHPGAIRKPRASAAGTVVPISGAVQTFDVFNPPPAFRPLVGFGTATALNDDPTNPPVFAGSLTPINQYPVWSQNEQFIIFSSNRTLTGGVQANGRFHLWAISVNGGEAFQITDSQTSASGAALPAGGGEFFPALSPSNNALAFTSDAQSPGVQNLYALQSNSAFSPGAFSFDTLTALNNTRPLVNVADSTVITSLTIRSATPTVDPQPTGFSGVGRPTFSASEGQIVFPAFSTTGTNAGHVHLYFLNTNTRGFDANNVSFPGKLTDGPADDTDPAFSPDGQFIAFASTAASIATNPNTATNSPDPSNPDNSQTVTTGGTTGGNRSIYLLSGGGSGAGFGTVVQGGQPGNATQLPGGRVSIAGTDDSGPAWSNFVNQNRYTNPTGNLAYLAFARSTGRSAPHDIVYLQVAQGVNSPNTQTLTGETNANPVVTLNTDDNAGETSSTGNVFDDLYPSWSPFLSVFSLTYSSNRTVTYNDPATGFPREVAASIVGTGQGQALNPDGSVSYTVGSGYQGLLISQLLNLDPPTLLRFNANEVVHVQAPGPNPVTGTANKLAGAGANRTVTMTVRLSNREANIDDTGGPNGGPRVYIQLKDPDSKYQDGQNVEHKVFAKDRRYDVTTGANPQANHPTNDITSGTMDALLDRYDPNPPDNPQSTVAVPISGFGFAEGTDFNFLVNQPDAAYSFAAPLFFPVAGNNTGVQSKKYVYPSYGPKVGMIPVGYVYPRGAHGGMWPPDATLNPDNTYIFIGTDGGGANPGLPQANNTPATQPVGAQFNIPGGDPRLFIPWGPEYETEVINPQFASSTNANAPADPTPLASRFASTVSNPGATVGDFVSPFWLAGVDDQGAFSGGTWSGNTDASLLPKSGTQTVTNGVTQTDRPTANFTDGGGTRHPAEWLQLQRVPAAQQDNAGGVLYTANFTAPATGSDFFVDVIAYDKAAFPNIPNTGFQGKRSNWRVYDNVGGFSTNQNITNNDILVVSDYALGQKFAATTFGGRNSVQNLVPKLFGTESYLTDIDVSRLPDSVYGGFPIGQPPMAPITATSKPILASKTYQFDAAVQPFIGGTRSILSGLGAAQNGLGVGSYLDTVINDNAVSADGNPNVQSQRYSVWRILSRGPVPQRVLNSYLPNPILQPAVLDVGATAAAYKNVPAASVLDAHRCVIWLSPYTGDVLEDPGALDDPGTVNGAGRNSTTQNLTAFVQGGGRLCITGQDVGSTLTQSGTLSNAPSTNPAAPNFLPDVLNATLVSTGNVVRALSGSQNRITGNPQFDQDYNGSGSSYLTLIGAFAIGNGNFSNGDGQYAFPSFNNFSFGYPNYPYQDNLVIGDSDFGDSALSQIPPLVLPTDSSLQSLPGASLQGQPDTIAATNGAVSAATYGAGGPTALVYHDDPFGLPAKGATAGQLPNGGTGSRVVYAAFGLEALTNDYYADVPPSEDATDTNAPAFDSRIPPVLPRNPRSAILHNIVDFLRTGQVTGTITQTSGTGQGGGLGIDNVTVYLVSATGAAPPTRVTFSATTSNGGRFTILGVEPGTYFLSAVKPGFQRAPSNSNTAFTVEGDVTVTGRTLTLTPLPNGSVAGLVKDTAGNPIPGAKVTITSQDDSVTQTVTTPTNIPASINLADNYFFQSVPVSNYTAIATGPTNPNGNLEYHSSTGTNSAAPDPPNDQGFTVTSSPTVDGVNFTLTPVLATISGRVFNTVIGDTAPGGASAGGATVNLVDGTGATVLTTTADGNGNYTFTGVPSSTTATTYTITASKAGFGQPATPIVTVTVYLGDVITVNTVPTPDVGITPLASISGQIFDASVGDPATGAPAAGGTNVAGATVTLTDPTGAVAATTSASATGTYTFTNVQPGTYTVTATRVGFTTNSSPPFTVVLGSIITGKDVGLAPIAPGSITGTVTDANGAGVAGALVTFTSADTTTTLTATADANGNYSLPTVFPGTYNGTATGPLNPNGRPTTTQGTVTVTVASAPAVTTANFSVVTIPPSISGIVTDAKTNAPLPSALVTVTDTATGAVIQTLHTDATGAYSTGPLPASGLPFSQYTVTVTAALVRYVTQSLPSQSIYDGDTLTENIALVPAAAGSVSGQVTDLTTGAGVSGAAVQLVSTDGTLTLGPVTTDANGNYSIPHPPSESGNYVASVTPPKNLNGKFEFSPAPTQNVTIPPGGTQTVNFVLTEILPAVSGTVLDNQTGIPISGVTVTLTDSTGKAIGTPQTTGADGTYSFANIPAGQTPAAFALTAVAPGAYFANAISVLLSLGDSLTGQNIGLDEKGTITGLVTDGSTGQPLPNVALTVTDTTTKAAPTNLTPTPLVTTPGTTIGPDGKTSNYTATFTLTPGHSYAVSASKPNYNPAAAVPVTPSPLTAGQAGRADLQLTSGIGTLGGLVSDATTNTPVGGATVTVTSVGATGASTVVATFTTNSSISPAPDGKTQGVNYSGQVAQGTYTVTLTYGSRTPVVQKVTVVGGQFNRLDFTGATGTPPVHTFPAGLEFLSTPYDYSSLSFDTLFGLLNTAPTGTPPNGNRTHVAVWDPTVSQYAIDPNAPADSLRLGVGYWVFLKNPVPVTVQGATPSAAFVPVALHPSWNQIGVPNVNPIPVSSLMFDNGAGGMISFAAAASSQYHVVAPTLYSFDGSGYQPVTQSGVLQPWHAYWIQVYSGATIEIPTR